MQWYKTKFSSILLVLQVSIVSLVAQVKDVSVMGATSKLMDMGMDLGIVVVWRLYSGPMGMWVVMAGPRVRVLMHMGMELAMVKIRGCRVVPWACGW